MKQQIIFKDASISSFISLSGEQPRRTFSFEELPPRSVKVLESSLIHSDISKSVWQVWKVSPQDVRFSVRFIVSVHHFALNFEDVKM